MTLRKALSVFIVLVLLVGAAAPSSAQASKYSLTIHNDSIYQIWWLYVSPSDEGTWGRDQLNTHVLLPGSSFILTDIKFGEYDIKFVDKYKNACVLRNIRITEDASWQLTTSWLLGCEFHLSS